MVITEKTAVSLGVVSVVFGGVVWLTSVFAQVTYNGEKIESLKKKTDEFNTIVKSIDRRLSRIEGKLDINKTK